MSSSQKQSSERPAYSGNFRKLVVSIDVGTTFTAASYCILEPGVSPKFREVLRWLGQAAPDAKIPSVTYYDSKGMPRAFGPETEQDDTLQLAEDGSWQKASWFKLHFRPPHLPVIKGLTLSTLPARKSADDVLRDYLRYLNDQIKTYVTSGHGDGEKLWSTLFPSMSLILTIPNGWEGKQQNRIRNAAIRAGLVDKDGGRRVKFVYEAEAAVLYAFDSGSLGDWVVEDANLILCDCGGGTIDIASYNIKSVNPLKLEESTIPQCKIAGSVSVNEAARTWATGHLAGQIWFNDEVLRAAIANFNQNAKRLFRDASKSSLISLGIGSLSNSELGITRGKLKVPGNIMASFFEDSLEKIKEGLQFAHTSCNYVTDKVILVGGLSSSPYVFEQLQIWGQKVGLSLSLPEGPLSKAVANGALAWHFDNTVSSRLTKFHYGTTCHIPRAMIHDADLQGRSSFIRADGEECVDGVWNNIIAKNERAQNEQEFTAEFVTTFANNMHDSKLERSSILVYRRSIPPFFVFQTADGNMFEPGFEELCKIEVDLTALFLRAPVDYTATGGAYRRVFYEVCLTLGDTEVTARFRWKKTEKAKYTYGPATIMYD